MGGATRNRESLFAPGSDAECTTRALRDSVESREAKRPRLGGSSQSLTPRSPGRRPKRARDGDTKASRRKRPRLGSFAGRGPAGGAGGESPAGDGGAPPPCHADPSANRFSCARCRFFTFRLPWRRLAAAASGGCGGRDQPAEASWLEERVGLDGRWGVGCLLCARLTTRLSKRGPRPGRGADTGQDSVA